MSFPRLLPNNTVLRKKIVGQVRARTIEFYWADVRGLPAHSCPKRLNHKNFAGQVRAVFLRALLYTVFRMNIVEVPLSSTSTRILCVLNVCYNA